MAAGSVSALETVMFTDVRSSTELRTSIGDEEAQRRLRIVQDSVVSAVEEHHGEVVKALGDGLLATFGSPRQAIYCAVKIQQAVGNLAFGGRGEPISVRIGVNTGEVVRESNDIFGEAVNAAARIATLADGGETLVASVVKDLAGTVRDIEFIDRGLHDLKGFPEKWHLHGVRSTAIPVMFLDKTPFVGRQSELEQLRHHLDAARKGQGAIVMVGGEPGVGKTRLSEELAEEARRSGAIVFMGSCYDVETAVPFGPFVDILEATARSIPRDVFGQIVGDSGPELARFFPELRVMFPDIPDPVELPEEQERRYVFNSIGRYLSRAASAASVMLILDDLHWADEGTLQLLRYLSTAIENESVLIVGTYRDVELAVNRPLARTLEHMVRQRRAHRISLKRLARTDVASMLQRLAGSEPPATLVDAIYSETDGNAFFVEEVFRHLLEEGRLLDASGDWYPDLILEQIDVPESVRLVTGRRMERLGEETIEVLTHAAVIGRVFEVELLQKIEVWKGASLLDALDEAERARLIEPLPSGREPRYRFVHELVRQTLLADISLPRRQGLHLVIAQALEKAFGGSDERVSELAHHLYQAGAAAEVSSTIRYLIAAGDRAQSTGGAEESLRAYELALTLVQEDLDRATLLYKMGRSLRGLQRFDDAMKAWEEALDIFERHGDASQSSRVCLVMSDRCTWVGEWKQAVDILERGLDMPRVDDRSRGSLLALQGVAFAWLGDLEASIDRVERAEELGKSSGDLRVYWTARSARAIHHWCFNEHDRCIEVGEEVIEVLRRANAPWALATVLAFVQFSQVMRGRWDKANQALDELSSVSEQVGHPSAALFASRWRDSFIFAREGDAQRQVEAAERDREYSEGHQMPWSAESYSWGAIAQGLLGREAEALELAMKGDALAPPGAFRGAHRGALALRFAYSGRTHDLDEVVRDIEGRAKDPVMTLGRANEILFLVEALIVSGDRDGLARFHDLTEDLNRQMKWRSFALLPSAALLAGCKAARDEIQAADGLFEEAIREAMDNDAPAIVPTIRWLWGLCLARFSDDLERAAMTLTLAMEGAGRLGFVLIENRARAVIDELEMAAGDMKGSDR